MNIHVSDAGSGQPLVLTKKTINYLICLSEKYDTCEEINNWTLERYDLNTSGYSILYRQCTVKPVLGDHPWDKEKALLNEVQFIGNFLW